MIELFIALLLVPAATIAVWDSLMHRLSPLARKVTKLTGLIGVPVHELAHALVCLVFGMRITRMSFYQPNSATGTLGFVEYRYSPYSMGHAVGRALQGVAPLLAGATIVVLLLDSWGAFELPAPGVAALVSWIGAAAAGTLAMAWEQAWSGPVGFALVLLAMIISMHGVPSLADIVSGLRGLIMVLIIVLFVGGVVALAIDLFGIYEGELGSKFGDIVYQVMRIIETAMWGALYGAVSMIAMTLAGGVFLILMPTLVLYVVEFVRGARGEV